MAHPDSSGGSPEGGAPSDIEKAFAPDGPLAKDTPFFLRSIQRQQNTSTPLASEDRQERIARFGRDLMEDDFVESPARSNPPQSETPELPPDVVDQLRQEVISDLSVVLEITPDEDREGLIESGLKGKIQEYQQRQAASPAAPVSAPAMSAPEEEPEIPPPTAGTESQSRGELTEGEKIREEDINLSRARLSNITRELGRGQSEIEHERLSIKQIAEREWDQGERGPNDSKEEFVRRLVTEIRSGIIDNLVSSRLMPGQELENTAKGLERALSKMDYDSIMSAYTGLITDYYINRRELPKYKDKDGRDITVPIDVVWLDAYRSQLPEEVRGNDQKWNDWMISLGFDKSAVSEARDSEIARRAGEEHTVAAAPAEPETIIAAPQSPAPEPAGEVAAKPTAAEEPTDDEAPEELPQDIKDFLEIYRNYARSITPGDGTQLLTEDKIRQFIEEQNRVEILNLEGEERQKWLARRINADFYSKLVDFIVDQEVSAKSLVPQLEEVFDLDVQETIASYAYGWMGTVEEEAQRTGNLNEAQMFELKRRVDDWGEWAEIVRERISNRSESGAAEQSVKARNGEEQIRVLEPDLLEWQLSKYSNEQVKAEIQEERVLQRDRLQALMDSIGNASEGEDPLASYVRWALRNLALREDLVEEKITGSEYQNEVRIELGEIGFDFLVARYMPDEVMQSISFLPQEQQTVILRSLINPFVVNGRPGGIDALSADHYVLENDFVKTRKNRIEGKVDVEYVEKWLKAIEENPELARVAKQIEDSRSTSPADAAAVASDTTPASPPQGPEARSAAPPPAPEAKREPTRDDAMALADQYFNDPKRLEDEVVEDYSSKLLEALVAIDFNPEDPDENTRKQHMELLAYLRKRMSGEALDKLYGKLIEYYNSPES